MQGRPPAHSNETQYHEAADPIAPTPPSPPAGCPERPYDRFLAHVYFPDAVVTVNAPFRLA